MAYLGKYLKLSVIGLSLVTLIGGFSTQALAEAQRVQLSAFLVNVVESGGRKTGQLPISVYLDIKDREEADYVCGIAHRIRDKIINQLNGQTFHLTESGKLDVKKIRLDLWPVAYKVVKNVKLQNMLVTQGTGNVKSSAARTMIRTGCLRLSKE